MADANSISYSALACLTCIPIFRLSLHNGQNFSRGGGTCSGPISTKYARRVCVCARVRLRVCVCVVGSIWGLGGTTRTSHAAHLGHTFVFVRA